MDRVGSGGGSSGAKVVHGPPRPPSSSGKHRSHSVENSGGSGSDGDTRTEVEAKGRTHSHRGDQEHVKRCVCE